jgi:hypothetical protein
VTPARRTTRACYTLAATLSAGAAYLATLHWLYALPGVIGTAVLLAVADSYRIEARRVRARHERARRAALADEQLLPPADARRQLDEACCERWWTSLGRSHDETCRTLARRSAA